MDKWALGAALRRASLVAVGQKQVTFIVDVRTGKTVKTMKVIKKINEKELMAFVKEYVRKRDE